MDKSLQQLPIPFRITQASLNQTAFDFPRNIQNIFAAIDEAVAQQSDLLCLEELTLTGYDAGDDFQKTDNDVIGGSLADIALYAASKDPDLLISIGHPWRLAVKDVASSELLSSERRHNALFNRSNLPFNVQSFLGGGRILTMTAKTYLFNYERGYEKRYFAEWNTRDAQTLLGKGRALWIDIPGQDEKIPFGRPLLTIQTPAGFLNLAQIICEEKWIATRYDDGDGTDDAYEADGMVPAWCRLVGKEGLIAVIPDASPPVTGKINKHIHLVALASGFADLVVNTDGLGTSGSTFAQHGHRLIAQKGQLISFGERLSFQRMASTTQTVFLSPADAKSHMHTALTLPHRLAAPQYLKKPSAVFQAPPWDRFENPSQEAEETLRMTSLWLFDYMRKTRCQGIVEGLSGGMDSAFNTALVAVMVHLAMTELGADGFCREMSHLAYVDDIMGADARGGLDAAIATCMTHMLTAVYMGTQNSSRQTREAASFLITGGQWRGHTIKGLGGIYHERSIQDLIDFYALTFAVEDTSILAPPAKAELLSEVAAVFNLRPGSVLAADLKQRTAQMVRRFPELRNELVSAAIPRTSLAYENIQARARQALLMIFSNVEHKMAIANPNLDEARNAYSTFGGDLHSGTINLNGFIDKDKEIQLLTFLATTGVDGMGPLPCLLPVLDNEPSAELLPRDAAGRVIQNDQDALQRSFAQMNKISELMLEARTGPHHERRLNPGEVFTAAQKDLAFVGLDDNTLHNKVRVSYQKWWSGQQKIHASPIALSNGHSVDHQTSLRTPNLSGQDRWQLTQLGVRLLFTMAKKECNAYVGWDPSLEPAWQKRATRDETFVHQFEAELTRPSHAGLAFDVKALYDRTRTEGLAPTFGPVEPLHTSLRRVAERSLSR